MRTPTWLLLLSACAAPSPLPREVAIAPGDHARVQLVDLARNRSLLLENPAAAAARADATVPQTVMTQTVTKCVADADLQQLLDVFASRNMFAQAGGTEAPGARDALVVEVAGRRWIWSRRMAGLQEAELLFHEARTCFLAVFNNTVAYQQTDLRAEDLHRAGADLNAGSRSPQGASLPAARPRQ